MKCIPNGPFFIQILFKFPVVPDQIVDRVVDCQSYGDAGDKAGYHGKLDTQPSHNSEINDNGKQIGQHGNQSYFAGHKEDEHNPVNQDHGDA